MPSKAPKPKISLPDCSANSLCDASNCFPIEVIEEAEQQDGTAFLQNPESISNYRSQEELMIMCETVREQIINRTLPRESIEAMVEELSLYGFKCPEPLTNTSRILPGNGATDEIDYPAHYQYLHMDNPIEIPRVDHRVKSRRQSAKHPSKLR